MPILRWLNDEAARKTSSQIPYRLLEADPALSAPLPQGEGRGGEGNMLIQGDNLEALKALLPYYAGQVKCIYIDPPYNTQSAFEHYDDNLEHSTWLSTLYPRLELLRQLLREDGSIWVSIDDNEGHYLKVLMDEVFGRGNFITSITWVKRVSPANDAKRFSTDHDTILVFAKNKNEWFPNRLPRTETHNSYYKNPDNDPRGDWNSVTYTGNKNRKERPNLYYGIVTPGGEVIYPPETLTWRYSQETHQENVKNNLLYWGKDGKSKVPRLKMFLSDAEPIVPRTVWLASEIGSTQTAMVEQKTLSSQPFSTPKPELLLGRVLHLSTNPNDLVLDSFLGSGTTAAVAHKMGRRYIGIEMGEHAVTHCVPRLQKVIEGEQGGISKAVNWQGGGGFTFYRLGETVFDEQGKINPKVKFRALAAHVWFSETHTPLTPGPSPKGRGESSPLLGVHNETAYYLLYNGILGDKTPEGGNVLTARVLRELPQHQGKKVIYGEMCLLDEAILQKQEIMFKHIPYDIKAR